MESPLPSAILSYGMIEPLSPMDPLRDTLEHEVVAPLFRKVPASAVRDASVPEIVLQHRRRRAYLRVLDALVSRGSAKVPEELRRETEKLLRRWSSEQFPDAFKAIEDFEIRCAQEHDLVAARESGDPEKILAALETQYRRKIVERFGSLELKGIQTSHRVWQNLEEIYVPLHVEPLADESLDAERTALTLLTRKRAPVSRVLRDQSRVLIIGSPGSGKSTLVSYLAARTATGQLQEEFGWNRDLLPIILTVRAWKGSSLTARSISQHAECEIDLITRTLERQEALLLVDGLDEAQEATRTRLVDSLHRFLDRFPRIRAIVTSRPAGRPGEVEKQVQGFKPYQLADLAPQEVDDFIGKWCLAAEQSIRKDLTEAAQEARKASEDLKRRLSDSYSVQRIAVNPLLVTILCVVHRFLGRTIPEQRVTLYEKCLESLLYEWDRAKFAEGAAIGLLNAPAKSRLLAGIARKVHEKHLAELSEKDIVQHFALILPDLGRPPEDAKKIVEEIRDRSGVLVEKRPGYFGFSHLTFQEYLCALDYAQNREISALAARYEDPWWHEVIVLAAGIPGGQGGVIGRKLLAMRTTGALLLAAQCAETDLGMPLSIRLQIEKYLSKLVPPKDMATTDLMVHFGIAAAIVLSNRIFGDMTAIERVHSLIALSQIDYAPTIRAIAWCLRDKRKSDLHLGDGLFYSDTPACFAGYALARKALTLDIARIALQEACQHLDLLELNAIRNSLIVMEEFHKGAGRKVIDILENGIKAARRADVSRRVRNTA